MYLLGGLIERMTVHRIMKVLGVSLIVALAVASSTEAMAQAATAGDVITNANQSFRNFPFVLTALAYLLGLFCAIMGVFKFKEHVDSPSNHPLSTAVKRFLAGGM